MKPESLLTGLIIEMGTAALDKTIMESIESFKQESASENKTATDFLAWIKQKTTPVNSDSKDILEILFNAGAHILSNEFNRALNNFLEQYREDDFAYGNTPEGFYKWCKEEIELVALEMRKRQIEDNRARAKQQTINPSEQLIENN